MHDNLKWEVFASHIHHHHHCRHLHPPVYTINCLPHVGILKAKISCGLGLHKCLELWWQILMNVFFLFVMCRYGFFLKWFVQFEYPIQWHSEVSFIDTFALMAVVRVYFIKVKYITCYCLRLTIYFSWIHAETVTFIVSLSGNLQNLCDYIWDM